jgi:hypothetical protein
MGGYTKESSNLRARPNPLIAKRRGRALGILFRVRGSSYLLPDELPEGLPEGLAGRLGAAPGVVEPSLCWPETPPLEV